MNTTEAARGRWREILPALGVPAHFLTGRHQSCPMCGGKDRARWDDKDGSGSFICGQCGAGDGFALLRKFHGWDFKRAADEVDKIIGNLPMPKPRLVAHRLTVEDVARIWGDAREIDPGGAAEVYLMRRRNLVPMPRFGAVPDQDGCLLGEWPQALRFMPRMWHAPTRQYHPCMLALFTDPDGAISTIHRTYLADVIPRRMFLPRPIARGGAIRLGDAREKMGVAEGIETALSASAMCGMPAWATTSERLLREWEPPPEAKQITVFGDNDENYVGQAAAYHLANRLVRRGHDVNVQIPHEPGWDWNDVLKIEYGPRPHNDTGFAGEPLHDAEGEIGG